MTAYLDGLYLNSPHVSQYDGSIYANQNCTPTSFSNGLNAITGGRWHPSGADIRKLVARREETNPALPGWSLDDGKLAMSRMSPPIPFQVRSGQGWAGVVKAWESGLYVVMQGDSDRFTFGCSAAFDGDHCIGVSPIDDEAHTRHWINDPICPVGRLESDKTLRAYAEKLWTGIHFGVFLTPVPKEPLRTLWGPDVSAAIRAVDPTGKWTATAFTKAGHEYPGPSLGFGSVIEMADLRALAKRIKYKLPPTGVGPGFVTWIVEWVKR